VQIGVVPLDISEKFPVFPEAGCAITQIYIIQAPTLYTVSFQHGRTVFPVGFAVEIPDLTTVGTDECRSV
jgi:hypothetical protein